MSADLLDLDKFYSKPPPSQSKRPQQANYNFSVFTKPVILSSVSPFTLPTTTTTTTDDDDDGWGDFAEATPAQIPNPTPRPTGPIAATQNSPLGTNVSTRTVRSNTLEILTNSLINLEIPTSRPSPTPARGFQPPGFPLTQPTFTSQYSKPVISTSTINRPQQLLTPSLTTPLSVKTSPGHGTKKSDPNVLFDADDFAPNELDDEFGDFEGPTVLPQTNHPSSQKSTSMPSFDLLSLDSGFTSGSSLIASAAPTSNVPAPAVSNASLLGFYIPLTAVTKASTPAERHIPPDLNMSALLSTSSLPGPTSPYPHAPRSPSFHERNPYPSLSLKTPTQSSFNIVKKQDAAENLASPVTAWPSNEHSAVDEWPAFEDFPDDKPSVQGSIKAAKFNANKNKSHTMTQSTGISKSSTPETAWNWQGMESMASAVVTQGGEHASPPTNIPPPSVLMSILPDLFEIANKALFNPLTGLSTTAKKQIMEDPRTIAFFKGYLLIATVSGRIIAGRKVRWHRDKFLSQSMTISTAGGKGMKLAGVDKAQTIREDREAADVISSWKLYVGRLRSAIANANSAPSMRANPPLRVPELSDDMAIQTAKVVPTAPKVCVLCGLKRDERVVKIDYEVEDSFGEWWVEYWGHRACKNFWEKNEKALRSR